MVSIMFHADLLYNWCLVSETFCLCCADINDQSHFPPDIGALTWPVKALQIAFRIHIYFLFGNWWGLIRNCQYNAVLKIITSGMANWRLRHAKHATSASGMGTAVPFLI